MNKRLLAVVKLGGSLITDKTKPFTLRKHVIRQIAEELATAYEDARLLVVHGGGSFGHPVAAKYAIKEGHDGSKRKLEGFSQTRYWMTVLNLKVVEELAQRGLPAVPFQTSAFTYTVNKELREYWIKPLAKALKLGLVPVVGVARLVRAEFLSLKEREFVLAARSQGASDLRIIFSHILPNALGPVFVAAILGIGAAILTESALSFLGIGVQPPTPSWGNMLTAGKDNIEIAYWLSLFPGLAILITVLGYNLLGEGLRDALDPRLRA